MAPYAAELPPPLPGKKRKTFINCALLAGLCAALFLLVVAAFAGCFWFFFLRLSPVPEHTSTSPGEEAPDPRILADTWLSGLHAKAQFNGGVLVAKKGEPIFLEFYGTADLEGKVPLTRHSAFRLASVSKPFTAMAILRLAETGDLCLDDPITRLLPELPWDEVTIRHLLQHTGDLPDYLDIPETGFSVETPLTFEDVLHHLGTQHATFSPRPGREYSYSNTGYVLLATIVQRASQKPFHQAMNELIFLPLGMADSQVWHLDCAAPDRSNRVEGFSFGKPAVPGWQDGIAGDGGVFVSLNDFLKWDRALARGTLISGELWAEALTPPTLPEGNTSDYGYGWVIEGPDHHWHNGAWLAAATFVSRFPDEDALVVVLDNNANGFRVERIAGTLASLFGLQAEKQ